MPATSTPRTPEGRLVRRYRRQARLSIPAAAALAGISSTHWGNIERGSRAVAGGGQEDVTGLRDMIALMARAVGVPAAALETEGERPDAAADLRRLPGPAGESAPGAPPAPAPAEDAVLAGVRTLYPDDQVAEEIMSQQDTPLDQRRKELDRWRGVSDDPVLAAIMSRPHRSLAERWSDLGRWLAVSAAQGATPGERRALQVSGNGTATIPGKL